MSELHIPKSYRLALINIGLILVAIISTILFKNNSNASAFLVGLPMIVAGVLAIIGTIQVIKGRNEKKNLVFIIALLINVGSTLLFFSLIIANIIDMAQFFN